MQVDHPYQSETPLPLQTPRGSAAAPSSVAAMTNREIDEMHRDDLIELLAQFPDRFLEHRVKSRLKHLDEPTLRRLLFLCRRCERNLSRLQPARRFPHALC